MSLYAMLKTRPETSDHDIEEAFDGNLCRCTGYRPILDGAKTFVNSTTTTTKKACQSSCSVGGFCQSPNGGNCASHGGLHVIPDIEEETSTSPPLPSTSSSHPAIAEREGSVQLEFPKELLDRFTTGNLVRPESYCFEHYSTGGKWYHPASVDEFLSIMHQHPQAKIINGNTEIGIEARFKGSSFPILVYPADITELKTIQVNPESTGVWFGACMTLASFMDTLKKYVDPTTSPFKSYQVRGFQALLDNLKWFAGNQIRNVAGKNNNEIKLREEMALSFFSLLHPHPTSLPSLSLSLCVCFKL